MATVSALLIGCTFNLDGERAGFEVVNRLDMSVDVIYVRGNAQITIVEGLQPGDSVQINRFVAGGECRNESMIAKDETGAEVATFAGPVCDGTRWEIGRQDGSDNP